MTTAICIASGPSLTQADVDFCKGKGKVYAVKESALLAPWADVCYAADHDWWESNNGLPDFMGEKWTVSAEVSKKYGLHCIAYDSLKKWSNDPAWIATGGNSGFQALNLAVIQGATKVILLGYDMGHVGDKHWWTGQLKRNIRTSDYKLFIDRFAKAAPLIPVPVVNCTRGGYLECFPRGELHESL